MRRSSLIFTDRFFGWTIVCGLTRYDYEEVDFDLAAPFLCFLGLLNDAVPVVEDFLDLAVVALAELTVRNCCRVVSVRDEQLVAC